MQSVQFSTAAQMEKAVPQESLAKSFHCSKCTLIFKSKIYLFEHLNKVHCLGVDAALKDAGLKYAETKKVNIENRTAGKSFTCSSCDFTTCSQDILTNHEMACQITESTNSTEIIMMPVTLANQHNEPDEASSSKDLRTYKRPSQTISKYFAASPGSNVAPKLSSNTKETQILKETVCKVPATRTIDLYNQSAFSFLQSDHLFHTKHRESDSQKEQTNTAINNIEIARRANIESLKGPNIKKAKLEKDLPAVTENTNGKLSGNAEFSFEVSDEEEEKKLHLVNRDPAPPKVYFCKQCDFSDASFRLMSSHYQSNHLYVKCNAGYIQQSTDQSATFRCLECPVEFLSTVDLKWHYTEKHPEAPDVFKVKLNELRLAFKCFTCTFTCNEMEGLRHHYKEKHPTFEADNSLLFCQYLVREREEEPPQQVTCEQTSSPEKSVEVSPKRTSTTEVEIAPSHKPLPSSGPDLTPYKCSKCDFEHKSAVVMHVHYQKKHPEKSVSLDEIKHLARDTSRITPKKETLLNKKKVVHLQEKVTSFVLKRTPEASKASPELLRIENVRSLKDGAEMGKSPSKPDRKTTKDLETDEPIPSQKAKHKPELVLPNDSIKSSPELLSEATRKTLDFSALKQVKSPTNEKRPKILPSKPKRKTTNRSEDLEMDETVSSQKTKHKPELWGLPNDGILSSAELPSEATKKTQEFSTPKHVKSATNEGRPKTSPSKPKTEATQSKSDKLLCSSPLEMHYCQFCDYTSPNIRSIIGHHNAKHAADIFLSKEDIIQYSAEVIENNLKSQTLKTTLKTSEAQLKQNGAKEIKVYTDSAKLFYCHLCNFGNPSAQGVITHQSRVHKYQLSSRKSILKYTALIHEKLKKSSQGKSTLSPSALPLPIITEGDREMFFCPSCNYKNKELLEVQRHHFKAHRKYGCRSEISLYTLRVLKRLQKSSKSAANQEKLEGKKKETKSSSKTSSSSAQLSVKYSEPQRKLPCKYCTFTTQYVFLLMSHLKKVHHSKLSVNTVLRLCFRKGVLQSGYHCEWCVFSHKRAEAVYKHYKDQHPGCKQTSLSVVKSRLFVGCKELHTNDKRTEIKPVNQGQMSQSSGKNRGKKFKCAECSFKSNSKFSLTRHCNNIHPPLAKDDPLGPPSDKDTREKSQTEDLNEMPGLFESFQMPLEDGYQESLSTTAFKCPLCPATFNSQHGLSVHCGMKHLEVKEPEKQEEIQPDEKPEEIQGRMHVFKCPYCNYISTSYQGVLTHCQMKHPASTSRVKSFYLDAERLQDLDDNAKRNDPGEALKFSGYLCKACPRICAKLNNLRSHLERDHNKTALNKPKPAAKPSLGVKLAKAHRTLKSVAKPSLSTKKIYVRIKCKQCPYVSTTNVGLTKHLLREHKNTAPSDCVLKCMLCPQKYSFKTRLAKHYIKKHGKSAYLKHYVPLYQPVRKKQETSSQQQQKTLVKRLIFKCPSCPYVNTTYHGTLTHSQMKHPSISVRADELETGEIFVSSTVGCSKGKGSYDRGYLCTRCPQIHPSIKRLTAHCKKEHGNGAVSELFIKPEVEEKEDGNTVVGDEASSAPLKTSLENSVHLQREDGKAAASDSVSSRATVAKAAHLKKLVGKDSSYKCQLCAYSAFTRKLLQGHYKCSHKLDPLSTYKMLEKYNKRKNNFPIRYIQLKERLNLLCKKCPDCVFDSSQLLIDHYNAFHQLRSKSDFTVLSFGVKKGSTGLYKCKHCKVVLNGTKKLFTHLDRHRDQMKAALCKKSSFVISTADPQSPKVSRQDKLPVFESVEELNQWTGTPVEVVALRSSPQPSSSKLPGGDPSAEVQEAGHTCRRCQRTFMSLKGLRSHERSHAALGAIMKLDNVMNTEFKHNIKKYVVHKPDTSKPYRCSCCAYRTNFMALWQSHFLKNHQDVIEKEITEANNKDEAVSQSAVKEVPESSEKMKNLPELNEDPEDVEEPIESYSEPPNVQRQLTHYSLVAQNAEKTSLDLREISLPDFLLQCEMCNFNTEHLSSIRRHYANRHGKKILKCKDCEFYTGLKKNMEMHMETGHSTCQSKPTYLKDLRCPFCLYQTKNKNNMIDHIVLHREERVVPMEVRRPKLSRYLQGIVFRCHRCTFTSGSEENLRLHMMRHDDVKPYKCRLCYFDCTRLADLEEHLSDKHQVLRNHELVGQVSLDQLEARRENDKEQNSDSEELEVEKCNADRDGYDVPHTDNVPESHSTECMMLTITEVEGTQEQEEHEIKPYNSSVADITLDMTQQNTTALKRPEQDSQTREQSEALDHFAKQQHEITTESNADECGDADIKYDERSFAEKEGHTNKNQSTLTEGQKEKVTERSLTSGKMADIQADGLHFKAVHRKAQSIEAMVEDHIVRHVLLLDEDGNTHKSHKRPDQEGTFKMGQNTEGNGVDDGKNDNPIASEVGCTSLTQNLKFQDAIVANPATAKMNSVQGNSSKHRQGFRFEPHLLTLSPKYTQLKLRHRGSLGKLLANIKPEQKQSPKLLKEDVEPDVEKTVVKEEHPCMEQCEEKEEADPVEHRLDGKVEVTHVEECKVQDTPCGALTPMDGAAEPVPDEKLFTCELCGRNLMSISELNRHILRHRV